MLLHCSEDHVGNEAGIDCPLGAALAPLDELAGAKLHAITGAQCALVAVWASVWDSVVPVLAVNAVSELVLHHGTEIIYDLWEVYF